MCETINKSRLLNCKTGFGGIKAVGFLPYTKLSLSNGDYFEGNGMTASGTTASVYKFVLKNDANTYSEEFAPDRATGTTVYTGTLNLTLPILDRETRDQVKLLAYGMSQIFIEAFNGKIYVMGFEHGCELSGGNLTTGGARKDLSGYTLTFTSEEQNPLIWVGVTGSQIYNSAINMTGAITPS